MKLTRFEGNPIISPKADSWWQCAVTANPGAWYDEASKTVTMLYRASAADVEHKVYLGCAVSGDGYHFGRVGDEPAVVPSHGFDGGCVEDPRIVKFGEWYFITYASRPFPAGQYWLKTPNEQWKPPFASLDWPLCMRESMSSSGLLITRDFKEFYRGGRITHPMLDDRDAILFPERIGGRFAMLHRPMNWTGAKYGTDCPAIWMMLSDDLHDWDYSKSRLVAKAKFPWEKKVGGSTPPIKTDRGWFTIYHAVGPDLHYRLGVMMLDLNEPWKVVHRSPDWILQPEAPYELEGFYCGCIFPCGNVVIDGRLFVYYGAADRHVGVATVEFDRMVDWLCGFPA
jgi:beta-1,2-mannobiose phosphorylase / 1,2-beta-oligomannan phosphorylase